MPAAGTNLASATAPEVDSAPRARRATTDRRTLATRVAGALAALAIAAAALSQSSPATPPSEPDLPPEYRDAAPMLHDDEVEAPEEAVPPANAEPAPSTPKLELADASPEESESLNRLTQSKAWTSRALAALRLERYDCEASAGRLKTLATDPVWRVRVFAFACLARRGVALEPEFLAAERDNAVLRTVLRARYPFPQEELDARIRPLERSERPVPAMLALEILAALDRADDPAIRARMDELLSNVIFRMDRTEAGTLSGRLARITSGSNAARDYRWREWHRKNKHKPGYEPAALVPAEPSGTRQVEMNRIAALDATGFVAFERYVASVADRPMDLAILIDCTASMSREIAAAQSGVDDLFDFLGSVTAGVRIAIVGYRDRTDEWELKPYDFSPSLEDARKRLWSLSAGGGGDEPESVYAAMKTALAKFTWRPDAPPPTAQPIRACVLVGDAPPHVGEASLCIDMAKRAFARGVRFYGIVVRDKETGLKQEDAEDTPPRKPQDAEGAPTSPPTPPTAPPTTPPKTPPTKNSRTGRDGKTVEPPKAPPPMAQKRGSHTKFPEISEAGGGRAEILKDSDSLVAEIAQLTVADRYRSEFAAFFEAFRVLCK